jgi:hypothetical protein
MTRGGLNRNNPFLQNNIAVFDRLAGHDHRMGNRVIQINEPENPLQKRRNPDAVGPDNPGIAGIAGEIPMSIIPPSAFYNIVMIPLS